MTITIITPISTDICAFLRTVGPHSLMKQHSFKTLTSDKPIYWSDVIGSDMVIMQRPFSDYDLKLCNMIKNMYIPLLLEFDDLLTEIHPSYQHYDSYYGCAKNIGDMLYIADGVMVTTKALARELQRIEPSCMPTVIPNGWHDSLPMPMERKKSSGILWRGGGLHHVVDIMPDAEAFVRLKEHHQTFIGLNPWFITEHIPKWTFYKINDTPGYYKALATQLWSVCPVPLHDMVFNHCKSRLGWLEAIYAGCIALVPDVFEEWQGLPGCLQYKDTNDLYNQMKFHLDFPEAVDHAWKKGRDYIVENCMVSTINKKREELYAAIGNRS